MIEQSYENLNKLIEDSCRAYEYAWQHYDELKARKTAYTLYGPKTYHIGAASPSHLTKSRERKLLKKTRRENYTQYELGEDYQLFRVKHIKNYGEVDCTIQVFEMNGILYARHFFMDEKLFYTNQVEALKIVDGKPVYYAISSASANFLAVEFYEHPSDDTMLVTHYMYHPKCKITSRGVPVSWDAPFGDPASPVQVGCTEEARPNIDFAHWCK